jgi:integrase
VRACRRCGIEGITLHSLRHTFASRVVQAGLSLVEIQNLLGHASPITSLRYAHLAPNQAASKAVIVLDKFNGDVHRDEVECIVGHSNCETCDGVEKIVA